MGFFSGLIKEVVKEVGTDLKNEAINKAKSMSKDDWKNLSNKGKEMTSNIFRGTKGSSGSKIEESETPIPLDGVDISKRLFELGFTETEIDYFNEYLSCLNDGGDISDAERRLLDKLLSQNDIPKERVQILEAIANGEPIKKFFIPEKYSTDLNLKEEEKEYIEEFKQCLDDDNEVTDSERRLLNKLRDKFNISQERIEELEQMAVGKYFSKEEKEYYDEVIACLNEDGEITEGAKRLLDKLRKSLSISKDRSDELEEIAVEDN